MKATAGTRIDSRTNDHRQLHEKDSGDIMSGAEGVSRTVSEEPVQLVPLATVSVAPGSRYQIEGGPFGNRVIAGISEGRWDGERLAGQIVGAGGDWAMPGPAGTMLLDVRQVLETDDGAIIYVSYRGRSDKSRGTYTVAPTFETSDERYSWLNAVQAVGRGRFENGRLDYEMFEVR